MTTTVSPTTVSPTTLSTTSETPTAVSPVRAYDPTPRLADFSAAGRWKGRLSTSVEARRFGFTVAEPTSLGGTDEAANPIEYLLGSLAGCVSVVVETVAGELDVPVAAFESHATGTLDIRGFLGTADVSPHFQQLTLTLALTTSVPEAELADLKDQVRRRCPLLNLLTDAGIDLREVWVVRRP